MKKASKSHIVYKGLTFERDEKTLKAIPIAPQTIPGLKEIGWTVPIEPVTRSPEEEAAVVLAQEKPCFKLHLNSVLVHM